MKKNIQKFAVGVLLATGLTTSVSAQWQNLGTGAFSAGSAMYTSLAIDASGTPYVSYKDGGNSSKATVMKFNGTAWEAVGGAGFSTTETIGGITYSGAVVNKTSLAISPTDEPYIAYIAHGSVQGAPALKAAHVMKYNGTSWVNVGSPSYYDKVTDVSLAISPSGQAYRAYTDDDNSGKVSVEKMNGYWQTVGMNWFSAGKASYISLAVSPTSEEPYIAYKDEANANKATVMKFNGTAWENVGTTGFSAGVADRTSLAFSASGVPYIAYEDEANSNKATVMKFNGTAWETVGTAGFSPNYIDYPSLAISPSGEPFLAFRDPLAQSYKATVMKFNGTAWVNVGATTFSTDQVDSDLRLAISPSGQSYVAFSEVTNGYKATVMKYVEETTGVNDIVLNNVTAVYPNPANRVLNIETKENTNITIVNVLGAVVTTQNLQTGNNTVDVSNLENGVYFIQTANSGVIKFIKD